MKKHLLLLFQLRKLKMNSLAGSGQIENYGIADAAGYLFATWRRISGRGRHRPGTREPWPASRPADNNSHVCGFGGGDDFIEPAVHGDNRHAGRAKLAARPSAPWRRRSDRHWVSWRGHDSTP